MGIRLEKADFRSSSAQAKLIGTVVSILGAFIVTLYEGPQILKSTSPQNSTQNLTQSQDWILGGLLLAMTSIFASLFIIAQVMITSSQYSKQVFRITEWTHCFALINCLIYYSQALILKKHTSKLVVSLFYSSTIAILSALLSLIVEKDLSSWSLRSNLRIMAVIYAVSRLTL